MERTVRIGISGSYGGMNLGDEAILESIIVQIRKSLQADITVFSRNPNDTAARHRVERALPVRSLTRRESMHEIQNLDVFILGGVTDHITPWRATYRSTQLFGSGEVTYVLSQSGHMQAILNPPGNPKAKYYVQKGGGDLPATAEAWLQGAKEQAGSWWPFWIDWLQQRSGEKKAAPKKLGGKGFAVLDAAPGRYVLEQA